MAIKITEDGAVKYVNENDVDRTLFPNLSGAMGDEQYDALNGRLTVVEGKVSDLEECCDGVNTDIGQIKNDLSELEDNVNSTYIVETETGAIASFSDGADDVPIKDLTVAIEPVQSGSGDPSPSNVRPISGWTGANVTRTRKNLFRLGSLATKMNVGDMTITPNNDNTVTLNGTNTQTSINIHLDFGNWGNTPLTLKKQSADYQVTASVIVEGTVNGELQFYTGYISETGQASQVEIPTDTMKRTITVPATALRLRTWFNIRNGVTANNATVKFQVEYGSTATAYEPYQGETYEVDWQTEAGTVYGGTLNVTTGVLTVDRAVITMDGTQRIGHNGTLSYGGIQVVATPSPAKKLGATNAEGLLSDKFKIGDIAEPYTFAGRTSNANLVFNMPTDVTSIELAKTWFTNNPTQVSYLLATPQTYQLTAHEVSTILGQNNIFADCGDSTVQYRADTKLYIDKVLNT